VWLSMYYDKQLLGSRGWMQWTTDKASSRRLAPIRPLTPNSDARVCAWTHLIARLTTQLRINSTFSVTLVSPCPQPEYMHRFTMAMPPRVPLYSCTLGHSVLSTVVTSSSPTHRFVLLLFRCSIVNLWIPVLSSFFTARAIIAPDSSSFLHQYL
jgi:hypothetical protein